MKLFSSMGLVAILMMVFFGIGCQSKRAPEPVASLKRIHFDFDRSSVRPDMARILNANARYLKKHAGVNVVVEGHCDERGTNEYNMALGDRRARSSEHYLNARGISSNRIRTVSYGEERPLDRGHNEAAWYMNRRAEFVRQ